MARKSEKKYLQLYTLLKQNITSGLYDLDSRFPTEASIMEEFRVSRTTVRHALELLKQEGLVSSVKGHGTDLVSSFRSRDFEHGNNISEVFKVDFTFLVPKVESQTNSEILFDIVQAYDEVAAGLMVSEGELVHRIRWMHFVNNAPYLYLTNFVSVSSAPNLPESAKNMSSLYPVLENSFGMVFTGGVETVEPIVADFITSRLLEVPVGTPLTLLRRTAMSDKGPLEYSRCIIRPDLLRISLHLH